MTEQLIRRFIPDYENTQSPAVRERYGLLSGMVGIILNLLLAAGKCFAGLITGSIAIMADAFNNLSDAGSSVVTLVGFRMAARRADDDHPFGHGRIEYLAGLLVSLLILLVGVELGKTSLGKIFHPEEVNFSVLSMGILGASIAVKLWMSVFNRKLSRRIGSAAMAATAADSLSDAVATSAVLLGAVIGRFTGVAIDGWAGILVAVFILRAGWGAAKDTLDPLLGQAADSELVREIESAVLAHPEIVGIHDMVIHDYGPGRSMMCFHAEVPMTIDVMEAHDVIDGVEQEMKEKFGILTSVHMDPIATDNEQVNALRAHVEELVKEVDTALTIHDFRMTSGPQRTNLIFDVVAPRNGALSDSALAETIAARIHDEDPTRFAVIQVDHPFV